MKRQQKNNLFNAGVVIGLIIAGFSLPILYFIYLFIKAKFG